MRATISTILLLGLMSTGPAQAQEQAKLRVAHQFPANNYIWVEAGGVFTEAANELGGGAFDFTIFPSAQLGTDHVGLMKSGLADIVPLIPSYLPDKMPLSAVAELPNLFTTGCEGTDMLWSIAQPGGLLDQNEFAPQGFRPLFAAATTPYKIMLTSKQVKGLDDLQGLKIRAGGGAMDKTVRELGAVAIKVTGPELIDAVSRGTIDGAMFPYLALKPFDLQGKFGYSIEGVPLGTATIVYAISTKAWDGLTPEQQDVLTQAGARAQAHFCKYMDDQDKIARDEMVEAGLQPFAPEGEEAARWTAVLDRVADEWAAGMDGRNLPGSALLKAMRDARPAQ